MRENLILKSDSYKVGHWLQYPKGTTNVYSYLESRGGKYDTTVMFGLQYYLKRYLSTPITMEDIDEAEEIFTLHFGSADSFNRAGWERIVNEHDGFVPLTIRAVPEGTLVPNRNVLMTVESSVDHELTAFATNYLETLLHKIWYPITVATTSFYIKRLIKRYLEETGDVGGLESKLLEFKLHDFGYRGVSSEESAMIGGMAHLANFMGTDTLEAVVGARRFYHEAMAGFSINAAEHSTITAYGEDHEVDAFRNMIKQFGGVEGGLYAVVSDSYDIYNACEHLWGEQLRQEVIDAPAMLVVRPDSGDPRKVPLECVEILGRKFGYTINDKGYKVLEHVRVIQGDGIEYDSIEAILKSLKRAGWSADNIAFGMGGALLQKMDRDTNRFAFKASAIKVNDVWRMVYKNPVGDSGKMSKRGRLKLIKVRGVFQTTNDISPNEDCLELVWENGVAYNTTTLAEVRARINSYL